jgi:hypothetical protein
MGRCRPSGPPLADVPGMRVIRTAEGIDDLNGIALRGNALYYHFTREGSFRLSPPTAAASEAVLVNEALGTTWGMVATDDYLYTIHTNFRELWRTPLAGGEPEVVTSIGSPRGLTVADGVIYLASDDSLLRRPVDGVGPMLTGIALANPIYEGGQALSEISDLVVEGDRVYYREETGTLAWVKTDGSDCRIVAKHDGSSFDNRTWVMTATHFYLIIDDVDLVEIPREP